MAQRPVIVDCDPGQDDAVALLMALASPESLKVLGITCVAGNVPLEQPVTEALLPESQRQASAAPLGPWAGNDIRDARGARRRFARAEQPQGERCKAFVPCT